MSGKANRPPMTAAEIDELAESQGYGGRGQTAEVNRQLVSEIVGDMVEQMAQATDESRRFPLSDIDSVERVAREYVGACARKGRLPTVSGLAAALGRHRTTLYKYADEHKSFSDWLIEFSDRCGECASEAAMCGARAAIPTIFSLKARHGWRDVLAIEPIQQKNGITDESAAAIAAKYSALPND